MEMENALDMEIEKGTDLKGEIREEPQEGTDLISEERYNSVIFVI